MNYMLDPSQPESDIDQLFTEKNNPVNLANQLATSDLMDLDVFIEYFLYNALERFIDMTSGIPQSFINEMEENNIETSNHDTLFELWKERLKKIQYGFIKLDSQTAKEEELKLKKEGLKLFANHLNDLWN